ncbi:sigma-70 family RNA polymerase sigma factor [Streptomyces sp. NBC_00878]|uniref:sigma-70 family RNA polymerase sigma factor n=1 Tax=Streptomyces sp. NBC_00878 TaxID=2975854 RepID=UPI002257B73C|nr:sigma-70 family RNA polymerase sigma factor [Streptomyces sp. NBC_00878]MCX4906622.1 sigma-70 family RNA polymerase sigma factor [Streptomyces sp. NBC_00878]
MLDVETLALRFEAHRAHLHAVAHRMLGSLTEADDAVQEAWLRLSRSDVGAVENLGGWLTTVVGRVCLDMLRSRRTRREEPLGEPDSRPGGVGAPGGRVPDAVLGAGAGADPEEEALLADSVGLALLVVLETLSPAERLAFVLHDLFAVPFEEVATVVGRTPAAARQLASRARRRVQGGTPTSDADLERQREVVGAFLAAARDGDFDGLVAVLDPDVVARSGAAVTTGAAAVASGAITFGRLAGAGRPALVNGATGIVGFMEGRLVSVLTFTFVRGRIAVIDIVREAEWPVGAGLDTTCLDITYLDR